MTKVKNSLNDWRNRQLTSVPHRLVQAGFWGWMVEKHSLLASGTFSFGKYLVATAFTKPITFVFGSLNILGLGFLGKYFYTSGGDISILWDNMPTRAASGVYRGFSRIGSFFTKVYNFFQDPWSFIWGKSIDFNETNFCKDNKLVESYVNKIIREKEKTFEASVKNFLQKNGIFLPEKKNLYLLHGIADDRFYQYSKDIFNNLFVKKLKISFQQDSFNLIKYYQIKYQALLKEFSLNIKSLLEFKAYVSLNSELSGYIWEQKINNWKKLGFFKPSFGVRWRCLDYINVENIEYGYFEEPKFMKIAVKLKGPGSSNQWHFWWLKQYTGLVKQNVDKLLCDGISISRKFQIIVETEQLKWITKKYSWLEENYIPYHIIPPFMELERTEVENTSDFYELQRILSFHATSGNFEHYFYGILDSAFFTPTNYKYVCTQKEILDGTFANKSEIWNLVDPYPFAFCATECYPYSPGFGYFPQQKNYAWVTQYLVFMEKELQDFLGQVTFLRLTDITLLENYDKYQYLRSIHDSVIMGKTLQEREDILWSVLNSRISYLDFHLKLNFSDFDQPFREVMLNFRSKIHEWHNYNYLRIASKYTIGIHDEQIKYMRSKSQWDVIFNQDFWTVSQEDFDLKSKLQTKSII